MPFILAASGMVHWAHLIGAIAWLGGLLAGLTVLKPSLRDLDKAQARRLSLLVEVRFRLVVLLSALTLLFTGIFLVSQLFQGVSDSAAFLASPYGRALSIKVALGLIVVAGGLVNGLWLLPRLVLAIEERDEYAARARGKLINVVNAVVLVLGLAITVCVAVMRVAG
jgi:putative copper export protein